MAGKPHNIALRKAAKKEMIYPEVILDGHQALSAANGFGKMVRKSGYRVHACSILPCHTHMVIMRHHYAIEQVVRLLRQAGTKELLADGRHPFAHLRRSNGYLPSVWGQDLWKIFLFTDADIRRAIKYVEGNSIKEGKRPQHWRFVTPFTG